MSEEKSADLPWHLAAADSCEWPLCTRSGRSRGRRSQVAAEPGHPALRSRAIISALAAAGRSLLSCPYSPGRWQKPACRSAVSQLAAPLKVLPGDLERILEKLGERDGHEQKINENRSRSMSSPLRRSLSDFDRNRLGPKDDIAKHVGRRRVQGVADREARISPIASEGVAQGCDLPSLLLGVRCAPPRQAEHVDKPQPLRKRIPALC